MALEGINSIDVEAIGPIVTVTLVIFLILSLIKFYPFLKTLTGGGQVAMQSGDEDQGDANPFSQAKNPYDIPLTDIFYKYKHNNVHSWLNWISSQSPEIKDKAFEMLRAYLNNNPELLGLVACETLMAVAGFKHQDSFRIISNFMERMRGSWNRFKHVDGFYESAAEAIISLDQGKDAFDALKIEFMHLKPKKESKVVIKSLATHIMETNYTEDLEDFAIRSIADPLVQFNAKSVILAKLSELNDEKKSLAYGRLLEIYMGPSVLALTTDDHKIIIQIQDDLKKYIKRGNKWLLELLLSACENKKTVDLFAELLADIVSDDGLEFSQEDIIMLLKKPEPCRSLIKDALCVRQNLSAAEQGVVRFKFAQKDFIFSKILVNNEKKKETVTVAPILLDAYQTIKNNFFGENTRPKNGKYSFPLLVGNSPNEKIYLCRSLAANEKVAFVYIDLAQLFIDNNALSNLKKTVAHYKPALIYFDNFQEVFTGEANGEFKLKLKHFNKTIRELQGSPSLQMLGSFNGTTDFYDKDPLVEMLLIDKSRGDYKKLYAFDKPDEEFIREEIKRQINQLDPEKHEDFNVNNLLDYLFEETIGLTSLEFLSYISNYFSYSILGKGKLVDEKEYNNVKYQFDILAVSDEKIEHLKREFPISNNQDDDDDSQDDDLDTSSNLEAVINSI